MEAQAPAGRPDPEVAAASESETRVALDAEWRFVSCRALSPYLDGIVARLASTMGGLPTGENVALLDDPRLRTLALPSGTLIISIGMLQFLQDEAELAFVLGHELAHVASGAVASRMVRGGLAAVANEDRVEENGWVDAATDLIRLGYGRRREQEADARALDAILSLQYDPESAIRFLGRLRTAAESGVPEVAETYVAHPAPGYRVRKLERSLYGRVERDHVLRVNREVFRRAIRAASTGQLTETRLSSGKTESSPRRSVSPWLIWTAAAAATVGLVATVLHLLN
jgi:predicted Zn-dependent protease